MKNIRALACAALLAGLVVLAPPSHQARAAVTVLCAPNSMTPGIVRTILNPNNLPPSGQLYTLNGQGCALVQQADLAWFQSLGFTAGPPFGPNIPFSTGVATGITSFPIGSIPASSYIQHIMVQNTTANAVTGGIAFGSTSGGNDIITALACGANCLVYPTDASIAKRIFSTSAPQPIYATAVTNWNSANVTVSLVYGFF